MHIAADGETYGHHHKHGEMALSYALEFIERTGGARLTNYGEYLEKHPPRMEVEVFEHTAWSCAHGVERWKSDCGCTTGGLPGWNQKWRAPLRESLDWLRDRLSESFERESGGLLRDCWSARDAYIAVILDRNEETLRAFFAEHGVGDVAGERRIKALKLLEMSRQSLLMFTSCGWFFDDLSRIETTQVMRYACRAMQLCLEVGGPDHEPEFLHRLAAGRSNVPENGDGREIYTRFVRPARIDLHTVGAHFAMSSLFEEYAQRDRLYCYTVEVEDYQGFVAGRSKMAIGRVRIASGVVEESAIVSFGVLHLGDQNITASVRQYQGEVAYKEMLHDLSAAFARADFTETIRASTSTSGGALLGETALPGRAAASSTRSSTRRSRSGGGVPQDVRRSRAADAVPAGLRRAHAPRAALGGVRRQRRTPAVAGDRPPRRADAAAHDRRGEGLHAGTGQARAPVSPGSVRSSAVRSIFSTPQRSTTCCESPTACSRCSRRCPSR